MKTCEMSVRITFRIGFNEQRFLYASNIEQHEQVNVNVNAKVLAV